VFQDTAIGSAFATAFAIPNMFRRLFGEGALSAAFIPIYTQAQRDGAPEADRLASLTVAILGAVTGAITLVVEVVLLCILFLTPGTPDRDLSVQLIMVMLPFMPLICIVATLAGMLQVHGKFAAASSGPLILNAFMVAVGGYLLATHQHGSAVTAFIMGVATVGSAVTQLLWFLRLLRPHVAWTIDYRAAVPRARLMLRRFVPVAVGLGTLQINAFLDILISMFPIWFGPTLLGYAYPLDGKSAIILTTAQRLYQFPLGVFGIAVATAVFPMLARHAHEPEHFTDTLRRGLRLSFFIGLPASVGLLLVRLDATAVLFSGGTSGFSADGVLRTAAAVAGFAPGVWAYSLNHVLTRAFYAQGDTRTPMKIAVAMVGLNLVLNLTLIWWLREAGLAWSTSISATVQCAVLVVAARRFTSCDRPRDRSGTPSDHRGRSGHGIRRVPGARLDRPRQPLDDLSRAPGNRLRRGRRGLRPVRARDQSARSPLAGAAAQGAARMKSCFILST
jgi:putative peptidoglycan lipid II flippase